MSSRLLSKAKGCLVRVRRQLRRCLYTPTWKESIWNGLTVQPQRIANVKTALYDDKSAKPVNMRLAAGEISAVEAHRQIFAEHVTIPLCLLGWVVRTLHSSSLQSGRPRP